MNVEPNTQILDFFHKNLGDKVKVLSEIQSEMIIQIPKFYAQHFPDFFKKFDSVLSEL